MPNGTMYKHTGSQTKAVLKDPTALPGKEHQGSGVLQTPLNRREKRSQEKRLAKFMKGQR